MRNLWSPSPIPWIPSGTSGIHPSFHGFHIDYPGEGKVQQNIWTVLSLTVSWQNAAPFIFRSILIIFEIFLIGKGMGFFKIWAKNFASPFISTSINPHIFGSSYIYIHASMDCQIVAYMHISMDPDIFVSLQPWFHRSYGLYKKSPKSPYCLSLRSAILDKGWPWIWYLTTQDCSKTAHHLQMKPAPCSQILISLPPQIYRSSDLYISTSIDQQIPNICRSSDSSF